MFSWSIRVQDSKGGMEGEEGSSPAHRPIGDQDWPCLPPKVLQGVGRQLCVCSGVGAMCAHPCHSRHTMWNVSERLGLRTVSKYIHRYNFHWYSLSWYLLLWSAASPANDHLQSKKKTVIESNLLGCSEPQNVSPRHGDQSHPCCFKDKQRIKYYTPSTLLILLWKLGRIYNYLHFTAILINLFFDHWQAWGIGRGLKLPHWVLGITTVLFLRLNM